jgi:CBS domain containing-hemolysin-like protein
MISFAVTAVQAPPLLSGADVLLRILAVLLLITINAFFVTAEFSIVSVRRSRINQLVSDGDLEARTVQDLHRRLDRLLSTTQLGITLSSLALGWIGESTMAQLLITFAWRSPFPESARSVFAHSIAMPAAFLLIAYLQIVLGELCPKSVALLYSEELARLLGAPSLAIARIFTPLIWLLNQSTKLLLRTVGIRYTGQGWHNRVTPEELQLIISTSAESPGLEAEERELLTNVFEFADVTAREVMVPRTSIVALSRESTFRDLLEEVAASAYSRYPITGESLDDILGTVHFKDLAKPLVQGSVNLESALTELSTGIAPWIRPAQFVPETMPVSELLQRMQQLGQAMVMVVDEYGGTAGLITLQDLAAEIIGESQAPESLEEPDVQQMDEQTFLVRAQLDVEELNDLLELNLPTSEHYQTVGGFVIYRLQKIPLVGETLMFQTYELTYELKVVATDGPRLERIQIRQLDLAGLGSDPKEEDGMAIAATAGSTPTASPRFLLPPAVSEVELLGSHSAQSVQGKREDRSA